MSVLRGSYLVSGAHIWSQGLISGLRNANLVSGCKSIYERTYLAENILVKLELQGCISGLNLAPLMLVGS